MRILVSGRQDSNLRLLAPKASALAGLSYFPLNDTIEYSNKT